MTRDEAIEYIKNTPDIYFKQYLSRYDRKKNFPLCPNCKKHEIQPDPKKKGYYKCFGCEAYGNVFQFIGFEYGIKDKDFKEQINKAIEIYGIQINEGNNIKETKDLNVELKQDTAETEKKTDFTGYYNKCIKNLKDTDYLTKRGISNPELLERFKIGYAPQWKHPNRPNSTPRPMIIIPTGTDNSSYLARSTKCDFKSKAGSTNLFNPEDLKSDEENTVPVFITEGEIDALSILECGLKRRFKAVGLSNIGNKGRLISKLETMKSSKQPVPPLILYLDNDKHGEEASVKLKEDLDKLGIFCVRFNEVIEKHKDECKKNEELFKEDLEYLETLLKIKDPNEALINNKDKFEDALLYAYTKPLADYHEFYEEIRDNAKFEITKMQSSSKEKALLDYIKFSADKPVSATEFIKLNEILNGGFKGGWLYGIGAVPSLGKTTFVMQIADYIAQKEKRDICIFSLEMSENDLMLKSIIRENYRIFRKEQSKEPIKSVSKIFQIKKDESKKLMEDKYFATGWKLYFEEIGNHIHISQGIGDIGVQEIKQKVEEFDSDGRELPMVIVDYVQILSPYKSNTSEVKYITDKQNLDKNIMELKRIARDKDIPIIAISSFNRDNYTNEVSFKSFKESGAIEYSADVLIGMQLKVDRTGWNNESQTKLDEKKQKQINETKIKYPREVELVILKNRFGTAYGKIDFKYYPQYEFFEELEKENLSSSEQIEPKNKQSSNSHDSKKRKLKKFFA